MIIISYATKNTPYEKVINTYLLPGLKKWGLKYDIEYPEDKGSWQANTHLKAEFIKRMILKHKQAVVFLDADATIEKYPNLFFKLEQEKYDISYHELDWCYSKDTEVLTENGWKYFYELKENEKVATLNLKTNYLEYQKFYNFRCYPYKGKMYNFKHQTVNLLVPPNHNMLYIKDFGKEKYDKYHKIETDIASNLYNNKRFKIPRTCKWKGKLEKYFYLPSYTNNYGNNNNLNYHRKQVKIPMVLWIKFLAWYLSEGSLTNGGVSIGQKKDSKYYKEIRLIINLLTRILKCNYNIYDYKGKVSNFSIGSVQLANYLKQFGKAKYKFIPNYIKQLPTNFLKLFIDTYIKGDGSIAISKNKQIFTASLIMKQDLEELIFKIGLTYNTIKRISGFGHLIYVIALRTLPYISIRKHNKNIKNYNNNIYSIEVPNHTLYVRRGRGTQCWSGNCKMWRKQEGNPKREALSGTLFINYTENSLKFLDEWIELNKQSKNWEQRNMEEVLKKWKPKLKVYALPYSYITVIYRNNVLPLHMIKKEDIFILHWQASRQYRNWHKRNKN